MKQLVLIIILSLTLFSCSEYSRVVKSDDYDHKYQLANSFFEKGSYLKAINLFEQVYQRNPKNIQGEVSYYRLGIANYNLGDYLMASYYFSSFSEKFPNSQKSEETSYRNLLCLIKETPDYSLDQTQTNVTLNEIQIFIYKYPQSSKLDSCNLMMDQLRTRLETKDFEAVKLYDKTESYNSAVTTAETFIKDFPLSKFKEKAFEILIRNSYWLALNSVEEKKMDRIVKTIERYNTFVIEFPNSDFKNNLSSKVEKLKGIL
jgi:outer membrane protein assembly factor BamD